jgi:class 3 adenylate cyclase
MGLKQDITNKVTEILDTRFDTEEVSYVPDITNSKLTFGNTGLQFEATVLYIDMRGSTALLNTHNNPVVAKIHMAYFHTIVRIAKALGGEVRSFNGDSLLVFFQGTTKTTLSNAVKTAMQMKYMIANSESGINTLLVKYSAVDFGIGLDDGKILCTKIGLGRDSNNQDLIWIGNPVNRAVKISDECQSPYHIGISSFVYSNLNDDVKFSQGKDMWSPVTFSYNGKTEYYYKTSYYWEVV